MRPATRARLLALMVSALTALGGGGRLGVGIGLVGVLGVAVGLGAAGLGGGFTRAKPVVTLDVSFSGQTNGGAAVLPAGMTGARSSTRFVRTGLTTMASSGGALTSLSSNTLAIGRVTDSDTTKGLWVERSATNALANGRGAFTGWTLGSNVSGQTGPDGLASARHFSTPTSSRALFSATAGTFAAGTTVLPWLWVKAGTITNFQWGDYLTSNYEEAIGGNGALPASWQVVQSVPRPTSTGYAMYLILGEAYAAASRLHPQAVSYYNGASARATSEVFTNATAQDFYLWSASLEVNATYATTYVDYGSPRAAEALTVDAAIVAGSRFIFEVTFAPEWSTAQILHAIEGEPSYTFAAPSVSPGNHALWYLDPIDYCEIAWEHSGQVRCVAGGVPVVFPTAPPFAYGVPITLHVETGNGAASAWYDVGAGHVDMGTESTTQPAIQPSGIMYLFSRPSGGQIDATIQSVKLSKLGAGVSGTQYYASPSGAGTCLSSGSPCSIASAQALSLAGGGGATIWLADGTYYQTTTLNFADGGPNTTYRAMPGTTPIISGATLVTGAWTSIGGSKWTKTIPSAVDIEQLYVNGVRAVRPIAPVPGGTSNTWVLTGSGFTVDASTQTAVGAWSDGTADLAVELQGAGFYYGRMPITGVAGNAWTANSTVLANLMSLQPAFGITPDHTYVYGYSGSAALVTSAGDFHRSSATGLVTYYARTTDTNMGTGPVVEVAQLDTPATLAGTLGAPAVGIKLIGITIEGANNSGVRSNGYSFAGAGVTGSFYSGGVSYPNNTDYDYTPSAFTVTYASGGGMYGCTIRRSASNGLAILHGTDGFRVEGLTVTDVLGTAALIGETQVAYASEADTRKHTQNVVVRRSDFGTAGVQKGALLTSSGAATAYVSSLTFEQNNVHNVALVGLSVTGPVTPVLTGIKGGNMFKNNRVWNYNAVVFPQADLGCFHTSGGNLPSSSFTGNWASVQTSGSGILWYIDNYTAFVSIDDNVADTLGTSLYYVRYQDSTALKCHDVSMTGMHTAAVAQRLPASLASLVNVTETGTVKSTPLDATAISIKSQSGQSSPPPLPLLLPLADAVRRMLRRRRVANDNDQRSPVRRAA